MSRVIFHIDVNSAFLSWSAAKRLEEGDNFDIRTVPSIVGGDVSKRRGIVLAKSIPAKEYKITTGEPVFQAKAKCPNLLIVPPEYELYREQSDRLCSILSDFSPLIQRYSIDECFIDYTGMDFHFGEPVKAANLLREKIKNECGWTVNIGVSNNKLLAKMASDFKKPDNTHTLFENEVAEKMWPLPVEDLFSVGYSTAKILYQMGIKTIGELAHADINILKQFFKSYGYILWNFANGYDDSPIVPNHSIPIKSISNSTTTIKDIYFKEDAFKVLLSLCDSVAFRLRRNGSVTKLVCVSIKNTRFESCSMQSVLDNPIDSTMHIYKKARELFERLWQGEPLRNLGVRVGALSSNEVTQGYLFTPLNLEKCRSIDKATDKIRHRFGAESIIRATSLEMPFIHLTSSIEDTIFGLP